MKLSRSNFIDIVRRVVQAFPHTECTQPDTFAMIDSQIVLSRNNFDKTFQDYENGTFWSRKWELQGADPETLCRTYPAVVMEQKVVTKKSFLSKEVCWDWWINVIDIPDCRDCPDECSRSIEQVDSDIQLTLLNIVNEILRFNLYTIKIDGVEKSVWATPEELECLCEEPNCVLVNKCVSMEVLVDDGTFSAKSVQLGTGDRARISNVRIKICDCLTEDEKIKFEYCKESKDLIEIAHPKCSTC